MSFSNIDNKTDNMKVYVNTYIATFLIMCFASGFGISAYGGTIVMLLELALVAYILVCHFLNAKKKIQVKHVM